MTTIISTSSSDDFLYNRLIRLLQEVRLVQGGTACDATIRRHSIVRNYLIQKQKNSLESLESKYFLDDGQLDNYALENMSLQNNNSNVY